MRTKKRNVTVACTKSKKSKSDMYVMSAALHRTSLGEEKKEHKNKSIAHLLLFPPAFLSIICYIFLLSIR